MRDTPWARLLAYETGLVNQELLLCNEYLAAEDRILRVYVDNRVFLSDLEPTSCPHTTWDAVVEFAAVRRRQTAWVILGTWATSSFESTANNSIPRVPWNFVCLRLITPECRKRRGSVGAALRNLCGLRLRWISYRLVGEPGCRNRDRGIHQPHHIAHGQPLSFANETKCAG